MLIVGLQCGHDASVAVLSDGKVLVHLERERVTRTRHQAAMSADLIHSAVDYCGLSVSDVDLFAICTTQTLGYRSEDASRLRFDYAWETAERIGTDRFRRTVFDRAITISAQRSGMFENGSQLLWNSEWPDLADIWTSGRGLLGIDEVSTPVLERIFTTRSLADSLALPMTVTLDGQAFPAVGVMHQTAHAAAAYYQSGFDRAAVYSHDNGGSARWNGEYKGGMLYYGEGPRLTPIWTAPTMAGLIYSRSAHLIGLGGFGGPGKLMGLSAYGTPAFFDERFIGDTDVLADLYRNTRERQLEGWYEAIQERGRQLGYTYEREPLSPFGRDIAASAQRTFEELVLHVIERLQVLLTRTGRMTANLCLSGGCALNCPANSRIVEQTAFTSVFVPPSCDDGGLSIGAALYLHHNILDHERQDAYAPGSNIAALGRACTADALHKALASAADEFVVERDIDLAECAAEDLAAERTVALYQGRSESGPRALGHRSLLADPRKPDNWARVNDLKTRERWRPFAPACLAERLREHFDGGPEHSPHMLFNYRVKSRSLGAVTHVDGSARAQTVMRGSGPFRDVIEAFDRRTGTPVVLNTSLNGPGEPIVETPEHALNFLRRTDTDVLYLEANRVRRHSA